MEIFRKILKPAEVKRRCICIPRDKWGEFPEVGETIAIHDLKASSIYEVEVGSQRRLSMPHWYKQYSDVKPGDTVVFDITDGYLGLEVLKQKEPVGVVSLHQLVGTEIEGKKIVDVKYVTDKGTIVVVQELREIPVEEILKTI